MLYIYMWEIRQVEVSDYYKGHIELLHQLSHTCRNISYERYYHFVTKLHAQHAVYVIEDKSRIIASVTLFIESKILHDFGHVGHVEDVVVDEKYRSQGIGKELMKFIMKQCFDKQCYKVILNCNETNKMFYELCGFTYKNYGMVYYMA